MELNASDPTYNVAVFCFAFDVLNVQIAMTCFIYISDKNFSAWKNVVNFIIKKNVLYLKFWPKSKNLIDQSRKNQATTVYCWTGRYEGAIMLILLIRNPTPWGPG